MRKILISLITIVVGTTPALADNREIASLTKGMECVSYQLSKSNQRIRLSSENAIPGTTSAWALINAGPSDAIVFVSNGDRLPLAMFNGQISMIVGDARYQYAVGLRRNTTALVHVCR